jgi:hypothetical protein
MLLLLLALLNFRIFEGVLNYYKNQVFCGPALQQLDKNSIRDYLLYDVNIYVGDFALRRS